MSRYHVALYSKADRENACRVIMAAPTGARVEIKAAKRTIPQNERMWAMLTDVAQQLEWHGRKRTPDDWKLLFLDALKRELEVVPGINGGMVALRGNSSSDLSKSEMSDLMELIAAFGAEHGVTFHDHAEAA